MKVILLQDVHGSGKKDQVIEVSDGYARNYLLPRKLAKEATSEALNSIQNAKAAEKHRDDVKKAEAEKIAREMKGKIVTVEARGGEGGRLYGSITGAEIAAALKAQHAITIDKKKIELDEAIRAAGEYTFTIRLAAGISTRMQLHVVLAK